MPTTSRGACATPLPLGQTTTTPGALAVLLGLGVSPVELLDRHALGDWGDLDPGDRRRNERAVRDGDDRVVSHYRLTDDVWVYVITEWDRSVTTLLLPSEA